MNYGRTTSILFTSSPSLLLTLSNFRFGHFSVTALGVGPRLQEAESSRMVCGAQGGEDLPPYHRSNLRGLVLVDLRWQRMNVLLSHEAMPITLKHDQPQIPTLAEFPAATKQSAGAVNGEHTDVMSIIFSDKILVTITQQGMLAQWV